MAKTSREIRVILMKTRKHLKKGTRMYICTSIASAYLGSKVDVNDSSLLDYVKGSKVVPFSYYPTIRNIIFDKKYQ